ncbi:hypothetical protein [Streptomyces sp. SPB162]|uniref:DUF3592 domain-containing protein n=1 Tax=Streptomyces sp. SPB162 TaxID=2940560 RepID=UPI002406075A|nr:hypothetical protein [Streptomyces sp. SPB162]MDF9813085.1 hypothetical protein [Streptomyces sp. SPB162]
MENGADTGGPMGIWLVFAVFFGLLGLSPASKARGVRDLITHGERAPGVCDYVTWDEGNASAWCSFSTPDGRRRRFEVTGYGAPRFEAGDGVEVAYWKGSPRSAVVVEDEKNYTRVHRFAAIACFGLASVFGLAAVLVAVL